MNAVIAPTVNVGFHRSMRSSMFAGSNRKPSTIGIGTSNPTVRWATIPVMWNSGAMPSTQSSGVRSIHRR